MNDTLYGFPDMSNPYALAGIIAIGLFSIIALIIKRKKN